MDRLTRSISDPRTLAKLAGLELAGPRTIVEGYVVGHAQEPVPRLLRRVRRAPRVRPRRRPQVRRLEGLRPRPTSSTSSSTRRRPTSSATCCSTPASRMRYALGGPRDASRLRPVRRRGAGLPGPAAAGQRRPGHLRRRRSGASCGRAASRRTSSRCSTCWTPRPAGAEDRPRPDLPRPGRAARSAAWSSSSATCSTTPARCWPGLKHLRHHRHEVSCCTSSTRPSWSSRSRRPTLFRGLEQLPEVLTDPRALREGYLDQLGAFLDRAASTAADAEHRLRAAADRRGPRRGPVELPGLAGAR